MLTWRCLLDHWIHKIGIQEGGPEWRYRVGSVGTIQLAFKDMRLDEIIKEVYINKEEKIFRQ